MKKIFSYIFCFIFVLLFSSAAYANNFAYLIVDGQSGKIMASHRADEIRPPASLTKKMTLYLIFEALRAGKITLQTRFSVSKLATMQEPCNLWLKMGETINVKDIIYALVTRSANDVSIVIAEGLCGSVENFAAVMNKKAKELGMTKTKFYNPTGLPNKRQITTARDMMILARALYRDFPNEFSYFKAKKFHYNGKPIRNHNRMLNSFTGADGIKTGFTFASRFNISVSAQRVGIDGKPIRVFAVVLGGQTSVSRDKKAAELMEKAFKKLNATPRMQAITATQDDIDAIVEKIDETKVEEQPQEIEKSTIKPKRRNNKKAKIKAKPVASKAVEASQISVTLKTPKDSIDDILNSPISVNINRDLPTGWIRPKP